MSVASDVQIRIVERGSNDQRDALLFQPLVDPGDSREPWRGGADVEMSVLGQPNKEVLGVGRVVVCIDPSDDRWESSPGSTRATGLLKGCVRPSGGLCVVRAAGWHDCAGVQ